MIPYELPYFVVTPLVVGTIGYMKARKKGFILGFAAGVADNALSYYNVIKQHSVAWGIVGAMGSKLLYPTFSGNIHVQIFAGAVSGVIFSDVYSNGNILGVKSTTVQSLLGYFKGFAQILGNKEFVKQIAPQIITVILGQIVLQGIRDKLNYHNQAINNAFEHIAENLGMQEQSKFLSVIFKSTPLILIHGIGHLFISFATHYFQTRLAFAAQTQMQEKLLSSKALLLLSKDKHFNVFIHKFHEEITILSQEGSEILTVIMSVTIKGIPYGLFRLYNKLPEAIFGIWVYNQLTNYISDKLKANIQSYYTALNAKETKLAQIIDNDISNIKTVVEKDGIENLKGKLANLSKAILSIKNSIIYCTLLNDFVVSLQDTLSEALQLGIVGYSIFNYRIDFNERGLVLDAISNTQALLGWKIKFAQYLGRMDTSLQMINEQLYLIRKSEGTVDSYHKMKYIVAPNSKSLILEDIKLKVHSDLLLHLDHMVFEPNKIYAIMGPSGSGKSTLLSQIKGAFSDIEAEGTVYYPSVNGQKGKIVMLSQQDYFPFHSSLFEMVLYPELNNIKAERISAIHDRIVILFEELHFPYNASVFGQKKDWSTILSGGEKKKVAIISAIVKTPSILILDELFVALDKMSIIDIQNAIKKHLVKNSIVIIVDHHALENNFNKFYDNFLYVHNYGLAVYDSKTDINKTPHNTYIPFANATENVDMCPNPLFKGLHQFIHDE